MSRLRSPDSPPSYDGQALLRILGVGFGIAVVIGGTIGVGILRVPGAVAARAGSPALAIALWLVGGLYALLGAFALAELGTMTPEAGGYLAYARRAFGPAVGFAVGWGDFLVYCTALAYLSIAVGEFVASLAGSLAVPVKSVALATLAGSALLQWGGLRLSSRAQEVVSVLKAVGFVGLAAVCLVAGAAHLAPGTAHLAPGTTHLAPSTAHPAPSLVGLVLAFQLLVGTYGGWYSAIYFTEEDTDPGRHLPRALIGGVLLLTAIYVLVNLGLMAVLSPARMAASPFPAGDAAAVVFGARAEQLITILSIVSLVGIVHPLMMMGTRVLFAMARERGGAGRLTRVNRRGTPAPALVVVTAIACVLVATGTFDRLFAMVAIFVTVNYAGAMLSLYALRRREPDAPRPFRAWGYPWTVAIVLAASMAFLVGAIAADPANSAAALLLLAASWPVAAVARRV